MDEIGNTQYKLNTGLPKLQKTRMDTDMRELQTTFNDIMKKVEKNRDLIRNDINESLERFEEKNVRADGDSTKTRLTSVVVTENIMKISALKTKYTIRKQTLPKDVINLLDKVNKTILLDGTKSGSIDLFLQSIMSFYREYLKYVRIEMILLCQNISSSLIKPSEDHWESKLKEQIENVYSCMRRASVNYSQLIIRLNEYDLGGKNIDLVMDGISKLLRAFSKEVFKTDLSTSILASNTSLEHISDTATVSKQQLPFSDELLTIQNALFGLDSRLTSLKMRMEYRTPLLNAALPTEAEKLMKAQALLNQKQNQSQSIKLFNQYLPVALCAAHQKHVGLLSGALKKGISDINEGRTKALAAASGIVSEEKHQLNALKNRLVSDSLYKFKRCSEQDYIKYSGVEFTQ